MIADNDDWALDAAIEEIRRRFNQDTRGGKSLFSSEQAIQERPSLEALIAATPGFDRQPGRLDEDLGRERDP